MTKSDKQENGEAPSWESNWKLIRGLFPNWKPTDYEIDDLWFYYFDKPHSETDPNFVDQSLLREAIRSMKALSRFPTPCYPSVRQEYKRLHVNKRAAVFFRHTSGEDPEDVAALQGLTFERQKEIMRWSGTRLDAAKKIVHEVLPDMKRHGLELPLAWPAIYVGLIWAADLEIEGENYEDGTPQIRNFKEDGDLEEVEVEATDGEAEAGGDGE